MRVTVRYFAALREALGAQESVQVAPGTTAATSPRHADALRRGRALRCALNQVLVEETAPLADGAEVAFFPPVTGG